MEKPDSTGFQFKRSIQDYLSLGYLYLLILGVTSDSIFYGFLGINIINYASITDVILSPIIYLTRSISFPIVILLIPAGCYLYVAFLYKRHQKNREKEWYQKKHNIEELDKTFSQSALMRGLLLLSSITIFSAYLGYGLGGGVKTKGIIESGDFTTKHAITFNDGERINVKLIGHNSQYAFYVMKDSTQVTVSPIQGNIKKMETLK